MRTARIVILSLIAIAAAVVTFALQPPHANEARSLAKTTYDSNAAMSDNVYQQQVVALWGVKDLTEVISVQLDNPDQRPAILLFLGVLAICVIGVTGDNNRPKELEPATVSSAPTQGPAQPAPIDLPGIPPTYPPNGPPTTSP